MNRVKKARIMREMSQRDLAEASGLSRQLVSNIERGASRGYASTYRALALALGVSVEEIIEGAEEGKVPAPLLELSFEQRRKLLGLVATRGLPIIQGDMEDFAAIRREAMSRGMSREEFHAWYKQADVEEVREELLPEEGATLEEELEKA